MRPEIDHLDPIWKEGRDYQKVCGLDTSLNYAERSKSENVTKSNRFLPWRVTVGELGGVPEEPGDLCLFLDPDTDDWVLEAFLGDWWLDKSKRFCGPSAGKVGKKRPDLSERNRAQRGVPKGPFSDEHRAALSKAGLGRTFSEETRRRMSESAKNRTDRGPNKR